MIVDTQVIRALVKHMEHSCVSVSIPCLTILGNVANKDPEQRNVDAYFVVQV